MAVAILNLQNPMLRCSHTLKCKLVPHLFFNIHGWTQGQTDRQKVFPIHLFCSATGYKKKKHSRDKIHTNHFYSPKSII